MAALASRGNALEASAWTRTASVLSYMPIECGMRLGNSALESIDPFMKSGPGAAIGARRPEIKRLHPCQLQLPGQSAGFVEQAVLFVAGQQRFPRDNVRGHQSPPIAEPSCRRAYPA
jgi:hypothetical protein